MTLLNLLCSIQNHVMSVVSTSADVADSTPADDISTLKAMSFEELMNSVAQGLVKLAINLTVAIVVFYLGKFIINKIYTVVGRMLLRRKVDSSLMTFVLSFVKIVLYFILIVTVIGILGIETSSFLALFASAGVAIGMALSGTLQNFAGGVLILLLKPYKVKDYIEAQGYAGTVKEIQIFHTIIITFDNKAITIPNGVLSTGTINNWEREKSRRVDWVVGISYGDSVATARETILDIINADPRILHPDADETAEDETDTEDNVSDQEPDTPVARRGILHRIASALHRKKQRRLETAERVRREVEAKMPNPVKEPSVVVTELADSAVMLKARAWVNTKDYWDVYYAMYERIYTLLPESGIRFPFPQLDVHLDKNITP